MDKFTKTNLIILILRLAIPVKLFKEITLKYNLLTLKNV